MKAHILIVDDDKDFRSFVVDALWGEGHDVSEAEDGAAALRMCLKETFDVVVTDMGMPNRTGNELTAALKDKNYPAKFVAISGKPDADAALAIAEVYCADRILRKPVSVCELCETVEAVLRVEQAA